MRELRKYTPRFTLFLTYKVLKLVLVQENLYHSFTLFLTYKVLKPLSVAAEKLMVLHSS